MDTSAVLGALRLADAIALDIQRANENDNRIGGLRAYRQTMALRAHLYTAIRIITGGIVAQDTSSPEVK